MVRVLCGARAAVILSSLEARVGAGALIQLVLGPALPAALTEKHKVHKKSLHSLVVFPFVLHCLLQQLFTEGLFIKLGEKSLSFLRSH